MASGRNSKSKKSKKTLDLYHYTSKASMREIKKSRLIKQSTALGDTLLGNGVYFTTLSPSKGKDNIKRNNWDDNSYAIPNEKLQATVKVKIPRRKVKRHTTPGGRNIYMKEGDVDLSKYPYKAYSIKWPNKKLQRTTNYKLELIKALL